jgi:hypothetical protein
MEMDSSSLGKRAKAPPRSKPEKKLKDSSLQLSFTLNLGDTENGSIFNDP